MDNQKVILQIFWKNKRTVTHGIGAESFLKDFEKLFSISYGKHQTELKGKHLLGINTRGPKNARYI